MRTGWTPQGAEIVALNALTFLAGDLEKLNRFLLASGIDGATLRAQAGGRDLAVAVMDFLLSDEALLLEFCESNSMDPKGMLGVRHSLSGE
jgi:hypothetical protein